MVKQPSLQAHTWHHIRQPGKETRGALAWGGDYEVDWPGEETTGALACAPAWGGD